MRKIIALMALLLTFLMGNELPDLFFNKKAFIQRYATQVIDGLSSDFMKSKKEIVAKYCKFTSNRKDKFYQYIIYFERLGKKDIEYNFNYQPINIFNPYYKYFATIFPDSLNIDTEKFVYYRIKKIIFTDVNKNNLSRSTNVFLSKEDMFNNIIAYNKEDKLLYFLDNSFAAHLLHAITYNTSLSLSKMYSNGKIKDIMENQRYKIHLYKGFLHGYQLIKSGNTLVYKNNKIVIFNDSNSSRELRVIGPNLHDKDGSIILGDNKFHNKYVLKHIGFNNKTKVYSIRMFTKGRLGKMVAYRFSIMPYQ